MPNDYYTYIHQTPDGRVFYVGKGRGSRASRPSCRNPHWNSVVKNAGSFEWHIIADGLDEQAAYQHEKELIASLRAMGEKLCNITEGGDGGGRNKRMICCVETGQVFESATEAGRVLGISTAAIVITIKGARMQTAKGKRFFYVPEDATPEELDALLQVRLQAPPPILRTHKKPRSEEHRRKLSIVNSGKTHSAETRKKLSERQKGVVGGQHSSSKPVVCLTTGHQFPSSLEAAQWAVENGKARDVTKARHAIAQVLVKGGGKSCGFHWSRPEALRISTGAGI
jgi:hypothetical protein